MICPKKLLTIATLLLISTPLVAEPQSTIEPATTSLPVEEIQPPLALEAPTEAAEPQIIIEPATTSIAVDVIPEAEPTTEPTEPASEQEQQPAAPPIGGFGDFRMMFGTPSEIEVPSWPDNEYDPRPADSADKANELLLPLPCGGAMVFRRIEVGGQEGIMGEQEIELGSPSENHAPMDYRHTEHIAGSFGGDGRRHYYLGKYEVTALQYQAAMGECPEERNGRRPAVAVSWHDAVAFTQRYTEWLFEKAPQRLPQEDGVRGYLRLPTEAEWEYAARGGVAVDAEAFRHSFFPLGEEEVIEEYAWIRESVSSSFEPRPVGSLKPNPLGLYDILGNVAELVFDLFHLNVDGRTHGQAGGFLVKGGHFRSWRKGLRTSWRQEHPHFNPKTGKPNRLDSVGFRVALSAPVITSEKRFKAIRSAWDDKLDVLVPEVTEDIGQCQEKVEELTTSLSAVEHDLKQCLLESGKLEPPAFPNSPAPYTKPPRQMPSWEILRLELEQMDAAEIRRHALGYLKAEDSDRALLLFKQATRKGDGWSALAIGALYDPRLFEAKDFMPHHSPFSKANPELAMCWYKVAQSLGETSAAGRMKVLGARQIELKPGAEIQQTISSGRCELILEQYGAKP
ncbi:SUMF1/EgtB/PvdO family nonheme iron enzyme [Pseudomonadota bacterium]